MMRAWIVILLPLALLAGGCQSAGGPQLSAASAARGEFDLSTLKVVAFMGVAPGGTADKLAVPVFEPLLTRQLSGVSPPFVLVPLQEVEASAVRAGVHEDFVTLSNFWRDQQKVDKMLLQRFCTALGLQGILVCALREWMQEEAMPNADEPSYTKISAQLSVYEADSGRRVWQTRSTKTVEAVQYQDNDLDSLEGERPNSAGFVGGLRTGSDAPAVEDVATQVVEELVRALVQGEQGD